MKKVGFVYKILFGLAPYLGILIGMYYFSSGILAILIYHALVISLLISFKDDSFKRLFKGWNLKIGSLMILFGLLAGVIIYFLSDFIFLNANIISLRLGEFGLTGIYWILFGIYFIIVNPIVEEIFWRGFLNDGGKKSLIFDALFAGYHLLVLAFFVNSLGLLISFVCLTIASFIWRKISLTNKGMLIPFLSHNAADLSVIFIAIFF